MTTLPPTMLHHQDDWLTVYQGDCRDVLPTLADASVNCVVTSPPYWGLRDYGAEGQLGLEATPEEYVANLVAVFREVRRVLRDDGTVWLNLGDSYAGNGAVSQEQTDGDIRHATVGNALAKAQRRIGTVGGLKPKDLVGIPWRVAFALQADGWYLRSDIIWSKPNPMPESVTDRPTKAHEYLFLLSKRERYYYDQEAVAEGRAPEQIAWREKYSATVAEWGQRRENGVADSPRRGGNDGLAKQENGPTRNLRSVWTIATRPYPGAHFAVFPPELPERCIKAGCSERGVCPECGAPWERIREFTGELYMTPDMYGRPRTRVVTEDDYKIDGDSRRRQSTANGEPSGLATRVHKTVGWRPTCRHETLRPIGATILDPFAGSGTVGLVANRLSRRAILIDLNPAYIGQQMKRNAQLPAGLTA